MKMLFIGAGVIGTTYSYQLSRAGHDITHLVRKEKLSGYRERGIELRSLDMRTGKPERSETVYNPAFTDTLDPAAGHDFIIISVNSHQLSGVLEQLRGYSGPADIVFLQNIRPGEERLIAEALDQSRYFLAYPFMAGGGRNGRAIDSVIFGDFLSNTKLGETDGRTTPRLRQFKRALGEAGMKPRITKKIIPYIRTHYVWAAASLGAYMKAGSYDGFVSGTAHIRESYIAMRQAMETCRREGINPLAVSPTFLFYAPLFILAPFTARSYRTEAMRRMWEGHIAHSPEEMRVMYDDVLREGDRLDVTMPAYRAFAQHVERFLENIISQSKEGNIHD